MCRVSTDPYQVYDDADAICIFSAGLLVVLRERKRGLRLGIDVQCENIRACIMTGNIQCAFGRQSEIQVYVMEQYALLLVQRAGYNFPARFNQY